MVQGFAFDLVRFPVNQCHDHYYGDLWKQTLIETIVIEKTGTICVRPKKESTKKMK